MSSPNKGSSKTPVFPVGPAGRRELRRALIRSTDPSSTIQNFQQSHSLHSMVARAFGTTPRHEAAAVKKEEGNNKKDEDEGNSTPPVETLDTDSALTFLSHLGVSQHEVHKRIADTLLRQLEGEIRKTQAEGPLLDLLKSCWIYATTISELRPVLWTVLKQLGAKTPPAVLKALAEQDEKTGDLKHAEIFRPLPPLLKRLVWETDWEEKVPLELVEESDAKTLLERVESTLLSQTILPHLQQYCSNEFLIEQANKPFVATARERKILTTQRRALTVAATTTTTTATTAGASSVPSAPGSTSPTRGPSTLSTLTSRGSTAAHSAHTTMSAAEAMTSGKSIAAVRQLLSDTSGGTASASFRPKLLYAVLSMMIAKHGSIEDNLLGCADHLHCTLVADLLLSATGLPKAYQHVLRLATVLDDSVKAGILADTAIVKIQACLKNIFPADPEDEEEKKKAAEKKKQKDKPTPGKNAHDPLKEPTAAFKRQLNRIISASLSAMKDADPKNLFLNPVTDEIAPGYSKVIKKPMCIMTMEEKIDDFEYTTLQEWEDDVKLMFQNCITYNRGAAGQWFRGEAHRQGKVFKEEVLPQARRLYQKEVALRTQKEEDIIASKKRKHPGDDTRGEGLAASQVVPLPAVFKKSPRRAAAKKAAGSKEAASKGLFYIPSMPALASMLLADPFVVRLLLDRVLRSIRLDVTRGKSLPTGHSVVPSLLQLLHMAQWSNQVCACCGKHYVVPESGLIPPPSEQDASQEEILIRTIPYESLRCFMPLLSRLLLENELDQRVVLGGDLYDASHSMMEGRPPPPAPELWKTSNNIQAIVGLVEGALVHICRPGNASESSLSITYPKFAAALQEASNTLCDDRAFFLCLIQSLLRHKSKLNRNTRDVVVTNWLSHLQKPPRKRKRGSNRKQRKWGTMTSAAHECLILLLNEWGSLGNLLLPRDKLLKFSSEAVQAADASEMLPERKFSALWASDTQTDEESSVGDFEPIRKQYERLLGSLPENYRAQWKEEVGISDTDVKMEDADVKKEERSEAGAEVKKEEESAEKDQKAAVKKEES